MTPGQALKTPPEMQAQRRSGASSWIPCSWRRLPGPSKVWAIRTLPNYYRIQPRTQRPLPQSKAKMPTMLRTNMRVAPAVASSPRSGGGSDQVAEYVVKGSRGPIHPDRSAIARPSAPRASARASVVVSAIKVRATSIKAFRCRVSIVS